MRRESVCVCERECVCVCVCVCVSFQVFELKVLSALALRRLRGQPREEIEADIGTHTIYLHVHTVKI